MTLLKKLFNNSKKKNTILKKYINIKDNYKVSFEKINSIKKLVLKKSNHKKLVGDYNVYGMYNKQSELWTWVNILPKYTIHQIKYIEELKLKAFIFEKSSESSQIKLFFYQFLSNDMMIIPEKYIGLIIDLLLYLTNDLHIFKNNIDVHTVQFIGLSKIDELF